MDTSYRRYKTKSDKRFKVELFIPLRRGDLSQDFHFVARNIDNGKEKCEILFKINTLIFVQLNFPEEQIINLLAESGFKMMRGKLDNEDYKTEIIEIGYDDVNDKIKRPDNIYTPEEVFKQRYKIRQDILACLYRKQSIGATSKDLVDYVWCDTVLLIEELSYLRELKLISCDEFSQELITKGGDDLSGRAHISLGGKREYDAIMKDNIIEMNVHLEPFKNWVPVASNKIVFLAHRFNETAMADKIKEELNKVGFETREGKLDDLGRISEDILDKIKESGFCLALLTPSKEFRTSGFSTSSWVLMEIGAAISLDRDVLILAEDKVDQDEYVSKLQSDSEHIIFDRGNFDKKLNLGISRIVKEWEKHQLRGKS